MLRTRSLLRISVPAVSLLFLSAAACQPGTSAEADGQGGDGLGGESDGAGGHKASTGGSKSSGGSGSVKTGGSSQGGEAGGGSEAGGSSGGSDDGAGGAQSSSGGGATLPLPIERDVAVVVPGVDELRGVAFGDDGSVYASGFALDEAGDAWTAVVHLLPNGDLDPEFGLEGIALYNFVPREELDGGMGGAGPLPPTVINSGDEKSFGLVYLDENASLVDDYGSAIEEGGSLIVQLNLLNPQVTGKETRVALARLSASTGELVTPWGDSGLVSVKFGYDVGGSDVYNDGAWGVVVDPESTKGTLKLVVSGFGTPAPGAARTDNDRYIARLYQSTGAPDPEFNAGSAFTFNTAQQIADGGRRATVLPGGGILSAGYADLGESFGVHIVLVKLLPNGLPDGNFGFGTAQPGVARYNPFLDFGGAAEAYDVVQQSSGRLVTVGYGSVTAPNGAAPEGALSTLRQDIVVTGLLSRGLDTAFGTNGSFAVQSEADPPEVGLEALSAERFEDRGRALAVLKDDRIIYAGRYDLRPALFVGRKNGGLDETVGDALNGRFVYDEVAPDAAHFYAIAVSNDGGRVVATTNDDPNADGALVAFLSVGAK